MRRWLGRLVAVRTEEGTRHEARLRESTFVQACGRLATEASFQRLGAISERARFQPQKSLTDVYAHPTLPLTFRVSDGFYFFKTRFEDGFELLTWGLSSVTTKSNPMLASHPTSGGFHPDLAAHLDRVRSEQKRGRVPTAVRSLEDAVRGAEDFYRQSAGIGTLCTIGLSSVSFYLLPLIAGTSVALLLSGGTLGLISFCVVFVVGVAMQSLVLNLDATRATSNQPSEAVAELELAALPSSRTKRRCPYCHDAIEKDQSVACAGCMALHHEDCWDEHGECASCTNNSRFARHEVTRGRARPAPGKETSA